MLELVETQSIHTLTKYIEKQKDKTTKSTLILFKQPEFQKIQELIITEEPHPKEMVLLDLVKNLDGKKAILFAQYRAQVIHLKELLVEQGCRAREFMGKKDGFTKKMQEQTIEDFRNGVFEILVASSIGEEGLDIPAVDVVIFYEPIPSEIRSIQRRGRTGRFGKGEVFVLITKNTRDEYFYWASLKKEKKMKSILRNYQNPQKTPKLTGQTKMDHFI